MCCVLHRQLVDLQKQYAEIILQNEQLQQEMRNVQAVNEKLIHDSIALARRRATTNKTSKEYYKKNRTERLAKQKEYNKRKKQEVLSKEKEEKKEEAAEEKEAEKDAEKAEGYTEGVDNLQDKKLSTPAGQVVTNTRSVGIESTPTNTPVFVLVKKR